MADRVLREANETAAAAGVGADLRDAEHAAAVIAAYVKALRREGLEEDFVAAFALAFHGALVADFFGLLTGDA